MNNLYISNEHRSSSLQGVVVEKLPSPVKAAENRLTVLCPGFKNYIHSLSPNSIPPITRSSCVEASTSPKLTSSELTSSELTSSELTSERCSVFDSLRRCGTREGDRIVIYAAKFLGADLLHLRLTGDTLSGESEKLSSSLSYHDVQGMNECLILWQFLGFWAVVYPLEPIFMSAELNLCKWDN